MTIKEAVEQIKQSKDVRIVPLGKGCKIEVLKETQWVTIPLGCLNRNIAEDILRQANDKLILG